MSFELDGFVREWLERNPAGALLTQPKIYRIGDFDNTCPDASWSTATHSNASAPETVTVEKLMQAYDKILDIPSLPFDELWCGDLLRLARKMGAEIDPKGSLSCICGIPVRVDANIPRNKVLAVIQPAHLGELPSIYQIYDIGD